jgi:hypothetical protein
MPGDGPGRDDGGGEEAGWAWQLLRLLRKREGCCYNITLPGVHGRFASKGPGPGSLRRLCPRYGAARRIHQRFQIGGRQGAKRRAASPGSPQALSGQAPERWRSRVCSANATL